MKQKLPRELIINGCVYVKREKQAYPSNDIISACLTEFAVTRKQLISGSRIQPMPRCRMAIAYLLRESGLTQREIAGLVGNINHTSTIHYLKQAKKSVATGGILGEKIKNIKERLVHQLK